MGRYLALLAEWPEVSVGSLLQTEISRLVSGEGDSAETEQEMKADGAAGLHAKSNHATLICIYIIGLKRAEPCLGWLDSKWVAETSDGLRHHSRINGSFFFQLADPFHHLALDFNWLPTTSTWWDDASFHCTWN